MVRKAFDVYAVLFSFCFYVINDEEGDIGCGVKSYVEEVDEDHTAPDRKLASDKSADRGSDGRKKKGIHFEKHIVGAYPREIDRVSHYRHEKRGNSGEEEVKRLLGTLEGVVSRYEHDESAEDQCAMV